MAGEAYPIQSKILGAALTAYPNSFDLHKALLCSAMRTGQPAKVVQKVFVEAVTNIPEKVSCLWYRKTPDCSNIQSINCSGFFFNVGIDAHVVLL